MREHYPVLSYQRCRIFDEMQFIACINWIPVECTQNIKTDMFLCDKKNCRTYKMSTDVLRRNA